MSNVGEDFPVEQKMSPEEQRQELIRRMNEATGGQEIWQRS